MINLTKKAALEHIVKNGKLIAWVSNEPKLIFTAKYEVGARWSLGEVSGIISTATYFEKASPSSGIVVFKICGDAYLKENFNE